MLSLEIDDAAKTAVARFWCDGPVFMAVEYEDANREPLIIERGMTAKRFSSLADLFNKEAKKRNKKSNEGGENL